MTFYLNYFILCRCNISVVIMGETGCGKTRLIRFMCDLVAQGCRQGSNQVRNMLIMKVKILSIIIEQV